MRSSLWFEDMSGLTNLGLALVVVFVVILAALVADVYYVLRRRRFFRRNILAAHRSDRSDLATDTVSPGPSSKDLLDFFCWARQPRIEPDRALTRGSDGSPSEVIDALKLHASRVLFTIEEEEREDLESQVSLPSAEKGPNSGRARLKEHSPAESPVAVATVEEDGERTPFSTPCASPLYFTPSASPSRGVEYGGIGNLTESIAGK